MPRLPQVSGEDVSRLLQSLGYVLERQRGSHARFKLMDKRGTHFVTVPMHKTIAKGTLNDLLSRVSLWIGVSKEDLSDRL